MTTNLKKQSYSDITKGILYATITGILFGLEYLAVSWVFHHQSTNFSALAISTVNYCGAFLLALFFLGWRRDFWKRVIPSVKNHYIAMLSVGITIAIGIFLLFFSVINSSAGSTSLLERTQLLFIIFLGVVFLKERLNKKQILGIIISLIGFIGISTFPSDLSSLVICAIISAAFLYSLQSFIVKKYVPDVDGLVFSFVRAGIVSIILLVVFLIFEGINAPFPSISESILLALAGFFGAFISRYFYFEAHNLLPISFLNIFMLLEAVVVVLGEMLFFNFVPFSWTKIIAGSIILSGIGILASSKKE